MRLFIGKCNECDMKEVYSYFNKSIFKLDDYILLANGEKVTSLWNVTFDEYDIINYKKISSYNNVTISNEILRYKYFRRALKLVNKIRKSFSEVGLIPIELRKDCPHPRDIVFNGNCVDIYLAVNNVSSELKEYNNYYNINNDLHSDLLKELCDK